MKPLACALVLAAVAVLAGPARAQAPSVWRCGSSYSGAPCAGGRAVAMAEDRVSDADLARARQAARDERRAADAMERERLRREAMPASRAVAIGPAAKPAAPTKPAAGRKKRKAPGAGTGAGSGDDFVVRLPKPKKAPAAAG